MKKANMTILASVFIVASIIFSLGLGTMAYFSDTKTSTGNIIVAGTMDLELNVNFDLTNIFPCEELDPITVVFQNDGSIPGYMYTKVTYTDYNTEEGLSANSFAALIYVEAVTYEHYTLAGDWTGSPGNDLPNWMDIDLYYGNNDGYVSLYEMKKVGWIPYCDVEDPLPVGDGGRWVIKFHMADSLTSYPDGNIEFDVENNLPQDDGIEVTFTALLRSSPIT